MLMLAGLFTAPWIVVAFVYLGTPEAPAVLPRPVGSAVGPSRPAGKGPWGNLEITPIVISPPLEYVPSDWGRNAPAEWHFPGSAPDRVTGFLRSVGLTPTEVEQLLAQARSDSRISGTVVAPPASLVRSLSPEVRSRLYVQLGRSGLNFDQANSFQFSGASAGAWLDGSLMSPATRQLVEPLVYRHGNYVHFADIETIRSQIPSPEERQFLAKTLLRSATVLVRLSVDSMEEVGDLVEYWGIGGRRTDIRPLLESMAEVTGEAGIDVVHLLPSFARNHLYRYPKTTTADLTRPQLANCLWSSLNFFNLTPNDRFLDVAYALNALRTQYYVVEHGYQLGDVVALVDDQGDLFHAAVHIADGLVFSKNGASPVAPWVLMSIDQLKGFYQTRDANPRVIYHRPNAY